jgi:hypothetical protein
MYLEGEVRAQRRPRRVLRQLQRALVERLDDLVRELDLLVLTTTTTTTVLYRGDTILKHRK